MRRASILASSSALSRTLLSSSSSSTKQHYTRLFQAPSFYITGSSNRCFSSSRFPGGGSGTGTRFSLSLTGLLAATVAVGGSSLLVEEGAYAKQVVKPDLFPKDVVLYQYEACPFCNKVKGIVFVRAGSMA